MPSTVLMACGRRFRFDVAGLKRTFFITGTDTGVGKTALTALLARFLRARGVNAAALGSVVADDTSGTGGFVGARTGGGAAAAIGCVVGAGVGIGAGALTSTVLAGGAAGFGAITAVATGTLAAGTLAGLAAAGQAWGGAVATSACGEKCAMMMFAATPTATA